jgi:hypothetical protein
MNYNNLGLCALAEGNASESVELQRTSMAIFRDLKDTWGVAMTTGDLGSAVLLQGDVAAARDAFSESLKSRQNIQDAKGMAMALRSLAHLNLRGAALELADMQYRGALRLSLDVNDKGGMADSLEGLAHVTVAQGQPPVAARLFAAADGFRWRVGIVVPPTAALDQRGLLEQLRLALPAGRLDDLLREGEKEASLEQVVREVLATSSPVVEQVIAASLADR